MIGTLFAQEFRGSRRSLFTAVGILALVAAAAFILSALRVPVIGSLSFGLGAIAIVMVVPAVLGLLVERYWRTMYGREGYFTMTLPVRGRSLYWAKVLYGLAAAVVAAALAIIGVLAAVVTLMTSQGRSWSQAFAALGDGIAALDPAMAWFISGAALMQLVFTVIAGASLMSIGAQARFNHLGFGAPVIGAVILYFAMQILNLAGMLFIPIGLRIEGPDAGSIVPEGMLQGFIHGVTSRASGDPAAGMGPGQLAAGGSTTSGGLDVVGLGFIPVVLIALVVLAWWGARAVDRRTSLR